MPEGGPEEAVEASQRRPRPLAFQYGDLLSEREDLQGGIAATADEHCWNQPIAPDRKLLILKHDAVLATHR
jgi:hypothetical protein